MTNINIVQDDLEHQTQMWIGGQFIVGYEQFDVDPETQSRLEGMLEKAFLYGGYAKATEIKEVLNIT
ncbi:MAG: hypothetical protein GQ570_03480 [Helicobacteraceae bacterium]|nr:hypothetical protein [Helicobacteraceae bacterium]